MRVRRHSRPHHAGRDQSPLPDQGSVRDRVPGLRMLYSVLHGDLPAALAYNAVTLVLLLLAGGFFIASFVLRVSGRHLPRRTARSWPPFALAAVIILWGVLRNLPFEPFSALAVVGR